jgi:HD-GYP domain-containing protein (c-di-GMP phosphodiesterase class II)
MWSFTEALAETVDARTPYNGSHIRNVAKYAGMLADYYNKLYEQGKETEYFDTQRKEQLIMGALLHDIGKMIVPLEVMNKATRLDSKEELVYGRLNLIRAYYEIDGLNGRISKELATKKVQEVDSVKELIGKVNSAGFLPDDLLAQLENVLPLVYVKPDGEEIPYFTEEEKESLRVRKGTLTKEERGIMESHVVMTERILSKVHFNSYYANSPVWAATHHECLDGSGYPKGLKAEDLAVESRIMAVADICDALLASDRPYKKPMPKEKAFQIMQSMAGEGKLERKIVDYMQACMEEV